MKKPKILVVDNEEGIREGFAFGFEDKFSVFLAEKGEEALKIVKGEKDIDLVILDIVLPDIDGLEVLTKLRGIDPNISVIIITGFSTEERIIQALRYGANDYFEKPLNIDVIAERIKSLLEKNLTYLNKNSIPLKIKQVIKFIGEHYEEKITLKNISEYANLSSSHLSKLFRENVEISIGKYLTKFRLEKAKRMLKEGKVSITDICFSVGYQDLANFERAFKRAFRQTPREYRKSPQKNS